LTRYAFTTYITFSTQQYQARPLYRVARKKRATTADVHQFEDMHAEKFLRTFVQSLRALSIGLTWKVFAGQQKRKKRIYPITCALYAAWKFTLRNYKSDNYL